VPLLPVCVTVANHVAVARSVGAVLVVLLAVLLRGLAAVAAATLTYPI
jgi:hypothetical protein